MSDFRDLEFMWHGGGTIRFHGIPTLLTDRVGHHSYNVACIIMRLRPLASAKLLRAALKHDMAEHIVGDMPAPTKRALPDYGDHATFREVFGGHEEDTAREHGIDLEQDLEDHETWVLKFADAADGFRFCVDERRMGNAHPRLVYCADEFRKYLSALLYGTDNGEPWAPIDELHLAVNDPAQKIDVWFYRYITDLWRNAHGK